MNKFIIIYMWSILSLIIYLGYTYPFFGMFVLGMQLQAVISMLGLKGLDYTKEFYTMMLNPYIGKSIF